MSFSFRRPTGLSITVAVAASLVCALPAARAQEPAAGDETAALGLRRGGFLLLPWIELRTGYSDNLDRAPGPARAGRRSELGAGLEARSDWSRHSLSFDLRGSLEAIQGDWQDGERTADAVLAGRVDIYRDSALRLEAGHTYWGNADVSDRHVRGDAALDHRFNRLAVTLAGGVDRYDYRGDRSTETSLTEVAVSDYRQLRASLRASYEVSPLTSLFAEAAVNRRDHSRPVDASGHLRGSHGHAAAVGLAWSNGAKLSGEAAVGYLAQDPRDPTLAPVRGTTFDGRLAWQPSTLTRIAVSAATRAGETTLAGSGGYLLRRAAVDVEHALRRHVTLSGGLAHERAGFAGLDLEERTVEARVGIDYLLTPHLSLTAELAQTRFETTAPGGDYRANTVMVGVRVRR